MSNLIMYGMTIQKSIHPFRINFKEFKNHKGFSLYKYDKFQEKLVFLSYVRYNTRDKENNVITDLLKSQIASELKCTDFKFKYGFDFA